MLHFVNFVMTSVGSMAFDIDYARWLDEHQRLINNLRTAVNSHVTDSELQLLVDGVMSHYDEIFRLKSSGAKSDIFHILSGVWKSPAERCLMWLGGSRSSEVLKVVQYFIYYLFELYRKTCFINPILLFLISGTRKPNRAVNRTTACWHF